MYPQHPGLEACSGEAWRATVSHTESGTAEVAEHACDKQERLSLLSLLQVQICGPSLPTPGLSSVCAPDQGRVWQKSSSLGLHNLLADTSGDKGAHSSWAVLLLNTSWELPPGPAGKNPASLPTSPRLVAPLQEINSPASVPEVLLSSRCGEPLPGLCPAVVSSAVPAC